MPERLREQRYVQGVAGRTKGRSGDMESTTIVAIGSRDRPRPITAAGWLSVKGIGSG